MLLVVVVVVVHGRDRRDRDRDRHVAAINSRVPQHVAAMAKTMRMRIDAGGTLRVVGLVALRLAPLVAVVCVVADSLAYVDAHARLLAVHLTHLQHTTHTTHTTHALQA